MLAARQRAAGPHPVDVRRQEKSLSSLLNATLASSNSSAAFASHSARARKHTLRRSSPARPSKGVEQTTVRKYADVKAAEMWQAPLRNGPKPNTACLLHAWPEPDARFRSWRSKQRTPQTPPYGLLQTSCAMSVRSTARVRDAKLRPQRADQVDAEPHRMS